MHRIDYIIEVTCSALDVPVDKIMKDIRLRRYTEARAIITYLARQESFSYPVIGRALGRRHHGAIMNSQKRAETWIDVDAAFVKKLNKVRNFLGDSYGDYLNNDLHVKAVTRMDMCISRVTSLMGGLKKEMLELRKLKREFMKQRRRSKPGPSAAITRNN